MNKKIIFALSYLILLLVSCTKTNNDASIAKAVVEAYLQPGVKAQIKVTKQIITGADNSASLTINGLNVSVTYNGTTYNFTQDASGVYENTLIPIVAGGTYNLKFTYNNETITASTTVPEKPLNFTCTPTTVTIPNFNGGGFPTIPDPLKAKWSNSNSDYHYIAIKSVDTNPTEISTFGQGPPTSNTPDKASSKDIPFGEFKYYGRNALILYRVQAEVAALYNSTSSNSQNLSTVSTNVTNGLGIFTSLNIADTVFVIAN